MLLNSSSSGLWRSSLSVIHHPPLGDDPDIIFNDIKCLKPPPGLLSHRTHAHQDLRQLLPSPVLGVFPWLELQHDAVVAGGDSIQQGLGMPSFDVFQGCVELLEK